jgi:hypothetical protein
VIFVSLSLFNLVRTPLTLFPLALMDVIKLFVSINRISEFLNAEELDRYSGHSDSDGKGIFIGQGCTRLSYDNCTLPTVPVPSVADPDLFGRISRLQKWTSYKNFFEQLSTSPGTGIMNV